jgi:aspartyl-tRNA(Asn)/glutamyl-tRNA(Gln) amidotransferase subunit A
MNKEPSWAALLADTAHCWNDLDLAASSEALSRPYADWQAITAATAKTLPMDHVPSDFTTFLADSAVPGRLTLLATVESKLVIADPLEADLTQVAALLRSGELSSRELTEQALRRLHTLQKVTNACVAIDDELALSHATKCDIAREHSKVLGALHGVPLAHKDILYRKGITVGCGLKPRTPRPYACQGTAPVLQRLEKAGAINLGRLHMTEWAFDPSGANEELGPCRNPWSLDHVPGGSSSGSAVAVAGRAVFAALGTDTGGSIRIPAALCGITGLKPTHGLVNVAGSMPLSHSNDHIGPLARSAADCALIMQVIAGTDTLRSSILDHMQADFARVAGGSVANLMGLRIGVPQQFFRESVDDCIAEVLDESLRHLEELGAKIVPVPNFNWIALNAAGAIVTRVEASARTAKLRTLTGIRSALMERFEEGLGIPGSVYVQLLSERASYLKQFLDTVMANVDVLHVPVCPIVTPTHGVFQRGGEAAAETRRQLTVLNRPFNFLGLPGLALPCGFTTKAGKTEMPVGFQLIGRPYADAQLLALGAAWQQATSWHRMSPDHK